MLRVQRRNSTAAKGTTLSTTLWTLVAGCLLSATASAANNLRSDCTGADFLQSTAHPDPLTVAVVDLGNELGDGLRDPESDTPLDALSIDPEDSLAPLLYLAPRVATILENVFDDDSDASLLDEVARSAFDRSERRSIGRAPVAPVAEQREPAVIPRSENSGDNPELNIEPSYLKIHRQMYRTDI